MNYLVKVIISWAVYISAIMIGCFLIGHPVTLEFANGVLILLFVAGKFLGVRVNV